MHQNSSLTASESSSSADERHGSCVAGRSGHSHAHEEAESSAKQALSHGHGHEHEHEHSHEQGHAHGQSHGHTHGHEDSHEHGHTHAKNPYDRECEAPASAASYAFVCAFVAALVGVGIPTHVTSYQQSTLQATVLLWATVGLCFAYVAACTRSFFLVLTESVSVTYAIAGDWGRAHLLSPADKAEQKRRMKRLTWTNWAAVGSLAATVLCSIGLLVLCIQVSVAEWTSWCRGASIVHIDTPPSDPSFASDVVEECEHMFVSQQYLLVGMPGVLVLLEYFRWDKVRHFVQLASIVDAPPRPQKSDVPFDGLEKVHLDDHFSREARDAINDAAGAEMEQQ
ncbi:uncharacterized protein JCM10292_003000 [Rhodotorula paludigena]|uniref:uncharacterized protein n=1 Tax=Rhodotorula paludigena TaxID=86838 RepID=UPI00317EA42F